MGHPPAFPVCLTLNLAAGMRKGGGGGEGGRYIGVSDKQKQQRKKLGDGAR